MQINRKAYTLQTASFRGGQLSPMYGCVMNLIKWKGVTKVLYEAICTVLRIKMKSDKTDLHEQININVIDKNHLWWHSFRAFIETKKISYPFYFQRVIWKYLIVLGANLREIWFLKVGRSLLYFYNIDIVLFVKYKGSFFCTSFIKLHVDQKFWNGSLLILNA